jgi:hypothetical protein
MFSGKAGADPRVEHLKVLPETKTLAYYENPFITAVKSVIAQCYKTFYVRNLRIFEKASPCPGKPF